MIKRIDFGMLCFLLIGVMVLTFSVPSAEASGTIYILADGSINPPTAPISSVDNFTYTFTDDIYDKIVVDRSNIVIDGSGFTLNGSALSASTGFELNSENNVTIKDVYIWDFGIGIDLQNSCFNITVFANYIEQCGYGIRLGSRCSWNVIDNNTIADCTIGFVILLLFVGPENVPRYNIVSRNLITDCSDSGIYIDDGVENEFWGNTIANNLRGLFIAETEIVDDNRIYHNNFINSPDVHALEWFWPGSVTFWDDGYPSGGNYWDDYTGVDLYSGPNQDQLGSDGIGDTPYSIEDTGEHKDNYPLMTPIPHDIAIADVTPSKTVVAVDFTLEFSATVQNQGGQTESFNITLYIDTTELGRQEITLIAGNSTDVLFIWNTTGLPKGNYTIKACANQIPGESDLDDNNCTIFVIIAMIGDLTGPDGWPDGLCNMRDVGLVARYFGQNVPPAPPNCDLTGPTTGVPDGTINMRDVGLVARHFGETDP